MNRGYENLIEHLGTRQEHLESWLGRPIEGGRILVPRRPWRIEGDALVFPGNPVVMVERGIESARVLDEFIQLSTPADVARFARHYGPLGLCKHGLPAGHPLSSDSPLLAFDLRRLSDPSPSCSWASSEPVAAWQALAARACRLLEHAAAVRVRRRFTPGPEVQAWLDSLRDSPAFDDLREPRRIVTEEINWWLAAVGIGVRITLQGRNFIPRLWGHAQGILGVIAVQLLAALTGAESVAMCDGCGQPYQGKRPPSKGKQVGPNLARRNFCAACKAAGVPHRFAARDWYRKHKGR